MAAHGDAAFVFEGVDKGQAEGSAVLFELFERLVAAPAARRDARQIGVVRGRRSARARVATTGPSRGSGRGRRTVRSATSGRGRSRACLADARKARLRVRVVKAVFKAADVTGTSDAYVVGTLRDATSAKEDQVFRTKVVEKTVAPAWRHEMFFRVKPSTRKQIRDAERRNVARVWRTALGVRTPRWTRSSGRSRVPEKTPWERRLPSPPGAGVGATRRKTQTQTQTQTTGS